MRPVLSLLGLLLTGIGIGVHWPLGVARAVRASGGKTDRLDPARVSLRHRY